MKPTRCKACVSWWISYGSRLCIMYDLQPCQRRLLYRFQWFWSRKPSRFRVRGNRFISWCYSSLVFKKLFLILLRFIMAWWNDDSQCSLLFYLLIKVVFFKDLFLKIYNITNYIMNIKCNINYRKYIFHTFNYSPLIFRGFDWYLCALGLFYPILFLENCSDKLLI